MGMLRRMRLTPERTWVDRLRAVPPTVWIVAVLALLAVIGATTSDCCRDRGYMDNETPFDF